MSNIKKVTLITGYYNREWCVDDTIESLVGQSYDDINIIAFDDRSKDSTFEKLKKFESDKFSAIQFTKNTGFVNGLIQVINEFASKSEYIVIHGSGDIAKPTMVEKEIDLLDNNSNIVVASCHFSNIDPISRQEQVVRSKELVTNADLQLRNYISHGGTAFRKSTYDKIGGYKKIFKFSQDYDLWLRLTKHGDIRVIPEILYLRMANLDGVSVHPSKFIEQCLYTELAAQFNFLDDRSINKLEKEIFEHGINNVLPVNSSINKKIVKHFNSLILKGHDFDPKPFLESSQDYHKTYFKLLWHLNQTDLFRKLVTTAYKMKKAYSN